MAWLRSPLKELPDEELMLKYQRGNRGAFEILLDRHSQPLLNFIYRFIWNRELAEDLVQEVFLRVIRGAVDYRREAKFTTWLYTIARNLCIDTLRKQKFRDALSLDQPLGGDENGQPLIDRVADKSRGSDGYTEGRQIEAVLSKALLELPIEQREVFIMREFQGLSFKEIADILECPENTAKSRMRYALEQLRKSLADFN